MEEIQVPPTTPDMDKQLSKQVGAVDGHSNAQQQTHVATIQLITPPFDLQNLGPDQEDFERVTPPPALVQPSATETETDVQFQPPPSPALTSAPEDQTLSRATTPLSTATSELPAPADIAGVAEAAQTSNVHPRLDPDNAVYFSQQLLDKLFEHLADPSNTITPEQLEPSGRPLLLPKSRLFPDELRLVFAADLIDRVKLFLAFQIPGAHPGSGIETAYTFLSCTRRPWCEVKKLAIYGLLKNYQSGTLDVVYACRDMFNDGKPSVLDQPGLLPSPPQTTKAKPRPRRKPSKAQTPQVSRESERAGTLSRPSTGQAAQLLLSLAQPVREGVVESGSTRDVQQVPMQVAQQLQVLKVQHVQVQAVKQSVEPTKRATTPAAKPKKRKHEDEGDVKPAPKKAKTSRHGWNDNGKSSSEVFGRLVKNMLSARSSNKDDYTAFGDAILPDNRPDLDLPVPVLKHAESGANRKEGSPKKEDLGDTSGLHESEVKLCKKLGLTCDMYRCQKSRFFLGLEVFVEYNYQALKDGNSDFKLWNVGKSQCQMFNNMDVLKSSDMFQAFETWGWVEPMGKKNPSTKQWIISPSYLARFPESHRRRLMEEVAQYEANEAEKKRLGKESLTRAS